eukprot:UC4_evm8s1188
MLKTGAPSSSSSCGCGPTGCGGPAPPPNIQSSRSRYPDPPPHSGGAPIPLDPTKWHRRKNNKLDQFARYNEHDSTPTPPGPTFTYSGANLASLNFPVGSFSTGQILFQGDGTLQGWTIQNLFHNPEYTPLHSIPNNIFAVATSDNQAFVLATPQNYSKNNVALPRHEEAHVSAHQVNRLRSLPGIRSLTVQGRYPIADISYDIPGLPVSISMEAMSPCIPGENKASSLPVALFTFKVKAPSSNSKPVDVRLMQSQQNFLGWDGHTDCTSKPTPFWGGNVNAPLSGNGLDGVLMSNGSVDSRANNFGSLAVSVLAGEGVTPSLIMSAANEQDLFSQFEKDAGVSPASARATSPSPPGSSPAAAAVASVTVAPGETKTVTFILSWHFPNRTRVDMVGHSHDSNTWLPDILGNYYDNWFSNAEEVAEFVAASSSFLLGKTRIYRDSLYSSSLPWQVVDTAGGRVACMRSPTMWWTKSGIVLGNEGNVCCPLNCTHVYGYTVLLERLFPDMAKDMRISDFVRTFQPENGVPMRFGGGGFPIDGSLANIIKAYLVVQQADPDLKWLPSVWPNIKNAMEIIFRDFDVQGDGVFRVPQPNTYDSSINGANTFIGSYYVTGLRATAKMASLMGDEDFAQKCLDRAALSIKNYEKICWNEEFGYYTNDVTENNCQNSYGPGCFIDQLCAIGLSTATGLGYMFDPQHEASARKCIAKYNQVVKPPFQDLQKHLYDGDHAINVCSYPHGKLGNGMKYTTIVSTGFTWPVVAGCIFDRNLDDAMTITDNIRKRQDGRNRSPWNEPECNILYSRAMAGWNIFDQAAGFKYDSTQASLSYDPRWNAENFQCFFVLGSGWGNFKQQGSNGNVTSATIQVLHGSVTLRTLSLVSSATSVTASIDGSSVGASISKGVITFSEKIAFKAGQTLSILLHGTSVALNMVRNQGVRQRRSTTKCCESNGCCETACPEKRLLTKTEDTSEFSPAIALDFKTLCLYLIILVFGIFLGGMFSDCAAYRNIYRVTNEFIDLKVFPG